MKDRSQWIIRKCDSHEAMELQHVEDWQKVSAAERMKAAWDMVVEAWTLKNRDLDELRFQRIARCIKRGGS